MSSGDDDGPPAVVKVTDGRAARLIGQGAFVACVVCVAEADGCNWLRRVAFLAAAEQSGEMFAKAGADAVEGDGIDAGIGVGQDEADNPKSVPVAVVVVLRVGVEVKPQQENVDR